MLHGFLRDLLRELENIHLITLCRKHDPLKRILDLIDILRPAIAEQTFHGGRRKADFSVIFVIIDIQIVIQKTA